jgi:hypothetical protein
MDLRTHLLKRDQDESKRKIAALEAQLRMTVEALDVARKQKRVRVKQLKPRPRLKGDRIRLIIPDTHGAKADPAAISSCLADAKAIAPHEVILLGDHVDCGGFLAQHHTMGYVAESDYSYEEDIAHANAFLDSLQDAAPDAVIEYLEGNHERRVETWCVTETLRHRRDSEMLRRAFTPEHLLDLAARGIRYYRLSEFYDGLPVPGVIKRGKVFFFHGFSTAKNAAAATQAKVAGNCVFAHTHRAQSDISKPMGAGVVGSWNPGCLCIPQPLWQHGRPTDWTHGYAVEFISRTGNFLHLNVPIIDGQSLFTSLIHENNQSSRKAA